MIDRELLKELGFKKVGPTPDATDLHGFQNETWHIDLSETFSSGFYRVAGGDMWIEYDKEYDGDALNGETSSVADFIKHIINTIGYEAWEQSMGDDL